MSLYFVCGKVGAGKSYRGMVSILDQLLHYDRLIVPNLPVNLGALTDFLAKRHPTHNVCLLDHRRPALLGEEADADGMVFEPSRIRMLEEGELAEFYKVQGMPSSVLIDRHGVTRFTHVGFRPVDGAMYEAQLRELLAEK